MGKCCSLIVIGILVGTPCLSMAEESGPQAAGFKLIYEASEPGDSGRLAVDPLGRFVFVRASGRAPGPHGALVFQWATQEDRVYIEPVPITIRHESLGGGVVTTFSRDGKHLFVNAGDRGILSVEVDSWKVAHVATSTAPGFSKLVTSRLGNIVLGLLHGEPSLLAVFVQDSESGKLTQKQVFQTDKATLEQILADYTARARERGMPPSAIPSVRSIPGAIDAPKMYVAQDLIATPDSQHVFVPCATGALVVFRADKKNAALQHVTTYTEHVRALVLANSAAYHASDRPNANDLIVAGEHTLSWLNWDATREELTMYRWWLDAESKKSAEDPTPTLPCVQTCKSIVFSKNGRYLFLASEYEASISVLELDNGDIKYAGAVNPPNVNDPKGAKDKPQALEVALSPDGKYLFSRYNNCALRVHELDKRYWK